MASMKPSNGSNPAPKSYARPGPHNYAHSRAQGMNIQHRARAAKSLGLCTHAGYGRGNVSGARGQECLCASRKITESVASFCHPLS